MIVKQIKYYNESDQKFLNNPLDITAEKLISGSYFYTITCKEIKIKAYPGTVLTINGETVIISLKVDKESVEFIRDTDLAYFIITFIQDDDDVTTEDDSSSSSKDDDGSSSGKDEDGDDSSTGKDEEIIPPNHDSGLKK